MFITLEGIEGAGKGTVLRTLQDWLTDSGTPCLFTREPGGSALGRQLRALLLDARQTVTPTAELFLYLADRAQHVSEVIKPALEEGRVVISDRYADSTIVYQGYGRQLDVEELYRLNSLAVGELWPDLTIILDVSPTIGLARARKRNADMGLEVAEGRFEALEMSFHERTRNGYLHWASQHPERFAIVNAEDSPEAVAQNCLRLVQEKIGSRGTGRAFL